MPINPIYTNHKYHYRLLTKVYENSNFSPKSVAQPSIQHQIHRYRWWWFFYIVKSRKQGTHNTHFAYNRLGQYTVAFQSFLLLFLDVVVDVLLDLFYAYSVLGVGLQHLSYQCSQLFWYFSLGWEFRSFFRFSCYLWDGVGDEGALSD